MKKILLNAVMALSAAGLLAYLVLPVLAPNASASVLLASSNSDDTEDPPEKPDHTPPVNPGGTEPVTGGGNDGATGGGTSDVVPPKPDGMRIALNA